MKRQGNAALVLFLMMVAIFGRGWGYRPGEAEQRAGGAFSPASEALKTAAAPSLTVPTGEVSGGDGAVVSAGVKISGVGAASSGASQAGISQAMTAAGAKSGQGSGERVHQVMRLEGAEVHTHVQRGVVCVRPTGTKGNVGANGVLSMARRSLEDPNESTLSYLGGHPELFNVPSPGESLVLRRGGVDERGMTHLRYQQRQNDIPIWGRELVSHFDASGQLSSINCFLEPVQEGLATKAALTASEAIAIAESESAKGAAEAGQAMMASGQAAALGLGATTELYYWNAGARQRLELVWVVEVHPNVVDRERYFIRASDGAVLHRYNATVSDGAATAQSKNLANETVTIHTYQIGSTYYMIDGSEPMFVSSQTSTQLKNDPQGVIYCVTANNSDLDSSTTLSHFTSSGNTWSDTSAVSAQDYMRQTYEFYYNLPNYSRNSFDNAGSTMMAVLHVTESGAKMDNAYWNGSFVVLGDGLTYFKPLAGGLDVVAHEFTHAVVQYTANLEYQYQSGALNETYADIGGVSVDTGDYKLGEDIIKSMTYFPTGALRDMSNPHNGGSSINDACWQPATMSEYQNMSANDDNGGVHINSGISNYAAYKMFNSLGRAKGDQILYRALEHYLTSQSNFTDFRLAAVQAAEDIYGSTSDEYAAVTQAFDDVGISEGTGTTPPADNPVVTGDQYIIGAGDYFKALYISDGFSSSDDLPNLDYHSLGGFNVNTSSGRPLSVDRYGNYIYVVDSHYNLRRIKPDGSGSLTMSYATPFWGWWSVAVSPKGNYLALTRNQNENIIYVYDLTQSPPTSSELILKHPTTDQNNTYDDIVQYADTMVFLDEHTIAYDCFNQIQSPGSGTIGFWDVNTIDIETGVILPVIPPQSSGVDVGNPTSASTNSAVLCVELVNDSAGTNAVTGVNLATGEIGTIFENGNSLAYPHYSPDDTHMIFTQSAGGGETVYQIELASDKIHASGTAEAVVSGLQLPYWFVVGSEPVVTVTAEFSAATSSVSESSSTFSIPVVLSESSSETITVSYSVTGGTATGGGVDYTLASGVLTFSAGTTTNNITGTITSHHQDVDKTIIITLSSPVNATLGSSYVHTLTILSAGDASPYALTTTINGGHATMTPSSGSYTQGTVVTLMVTPEDGYCVKGWHNTDNDATRASTNTVTLNTDKAVVVDIASVVTAATCTIKAGTNNNDSLVFKGNTLVSADQLSGATSCVVRILAEDLLIFEESLDVSGFKVKGGVYSYRHTQSKNDTLKVIALDLNTGKGTMLLKLQKADLTGLRCPVIIEVTMGDYSGLASAGEDVVNGSGAIPLSLLLGYADALRIDKASVTATALTMSGSIAVQNTDVDLSQYAMTVSWGGQSFVIPSGGFKKSGVRYVYSDSRGENGKLSWAAFDLTRGVFQIKVRKATIVDLSGTINVRLQFGTYDETAEYTIN